MENKIKKSQEYLNKGCRVNLVDKTHDQLFGGEEISVYLVRSAFQETIFLAEVGSFHVEADTPEKAIELLKNKLN